MTAGRYALPTMAEIAAAARPDGRTVISTFTGAGGSCLGFRMAGYRVLAACEFIESARATYVRNFRGVPVLSEDVRTLDPARLLHVAGAEVGEVDVLDGSPPCSAFSASGRREQGWGQVRRYSETRQRVDDLFLEFARVLRAVQPRAFVAENVPGLAQGASRGYFIEIRCALEGAGYNVAVKLLDASRLGVPQARRRLIFVGLRRDLADEAAGVTARACFPTPQAKVFTIRDAMASMPPPDARELTDRKDASIERYAIYEEWRRLGNGGGKGGRFFNLVRPDLDAPCPTVTATSASVGAAGVTHPTEPRKFTPNELKALSSFPADFALMGTFQQHYERIARAVPPLMMREIGAGVAAALDRAETEPRAA